MTEKENRPEQTGATLSYVLQRHQPMTPSHWTRVKEIFDAALERAPHQRAAFITTECGEDASLAAEVERLLDAHMQAGDFIERSPLATDEGAVGAARPVLTGRVIGRYHVGPLLGVGGMGAVYAARDVELGRDVALKVGTVNDGGAQARLRREAQHASQLNHPHICTIYEVGVVDDQAYIAMEYVNGQCLSDIIPSDGLATDRVLRYGTQIADGLSHAHGRGISHRDLKTANVVITPEGGAKILDFGLARRLAPKRLIELSESRASITSEHVIAGTLSTMAPEVLRGEPSDERSDVWSLGVLLYEMAASAKPFSGANGFELSGAILHEAPARLPAHVPASLRGIIERCLAKDPDQRYQHASDVRRALEELQLSTQNPPAPAQPVSWSMRRVRRVAAVVVLSLLLVVAGVLLSRARGPHPDGPVAIGPSGRPAIAVLPFENAGTTDKAWLSQGVPTMLLTGLAQTRGLDIVSTQRLHDALKQSGHEQLASLDRSQIAEVARRAGAGAIVVGSIFLSGAEIRIDARVEDLASGRVLAAESVSGSDVFAMVDQLASRVRAGIGLEDRAAVRHVAEVSTSSIEAFRAYAAGIDARTNFRFEAAEKFLEQAVAIDPAFAQAYLQLAIVTEGPGFRDRRVKYLSKAAQHVDRLSEREQLLLGLEVARANETFLEAARMLDDLVTRFPDVDVIYTIAIQLYHPVIGPLANREKLLSIARAGVDALPLSPVTRNVYGTALFAAGRYHDALREAETYARLAPREPEPHYVIGLTYVTMGLPEKAIDAYVRALAVDSNYVPAKEGRGIALAMLGRYDEATVQAQSPTALAMYLSRAGRYREATGTLAAAVRKAEATGNQNDLVFFNLLSSRLAIEVNDHGRAIQDAAAGLKFAAQLDRERARFYSVMAEMLRGVAESRMGKPDRARVHLHALQRLYKPTVVAETWFFKALEGEIALTMGQVDQATAAFSAGEPPSRAFRFGLAGGIVNNPPFRDGLARAAVLRGDVAGAIRIYRRLLTQEPDQKWLAVFEPRYVLEIARLLDRSGDRSTALQEYRRFLDYWKNADAQLPELRDARRAVTRLQAEN